ncbi:MAG: sugar phosphate isomerase/epimerase family protein [Candidatus Hydrogenedentota bacterium]
MSKRGTFIIRTMAFAMMAALTGGAGLAQAGEAWTEAGKAYSLRNFTLFESLEQTRALGMTEFEANPGQRLSPNHDVGMGPELSDSERAEVREKAASLGVDIVAFGVVTLTADEAQARPIFEFAEDMGIGILVAHPDLDSFDLLEELVQEFGIKVAIHNHGPESDYDKVTDTLEAVEGRHPYIGACVDTGHVIRSQEEPHEAVEALGERVHSLHLKDWEYAEGEKIVGEGDTDLSALANALRAADFEGPIALEYELQPDNPSPDMAIGLFNWRLAVLQTAPSEGL